MEPELLRESLATGWPCFGEKQSPEHFLGIFDRVGHFFSDCRKTEDWLRRQYDLVERTRKFAKTEPEVAQPAYSKRWNKLVTNPLGGIGVLSVPEKDVTALFRVICGMIDDAEALHAGVNDKGEVNLIEHFEQIRRLLEKRAVGKKIPLEDQKVMSFLEKRFSRARPEIESCRIGDLANVMPFFLGGKLQLEDEEDVPEYSKVYGLTDVESAHLDKRNSETLFCFFDANSLPFPPREYDWPMTPEYVRAIRLPKDAKETRKRLDDHCYYVESVVLSSRYLFHLARTLPKPIFSWIESKQGKEVQPSPYLELLGGGALAQRTVYVDHLLMGKKSSKGKLPMKPSRWDMNAAVEKYFTGGSSQPVDVLASRAACPQGWRRLWYDYGVCERPVFSTDFHLQFAVSLWIAVRAVTQSKGTNAAAWEIYVHYPVFSRSKQAEIANFAAKHTSTLKKYRSKHWKNIPYRVFLQLLRVQPTITFLEHGRMNEKDVPSLCTLCLHRNLCRGLIHDPID